MELKHDSMEDFVSFYATFRILQEYTILLKEFIKALESNPYQIEYNIRDGFGIEKAKRLLFIIQEYKYELFDFVEELKEEDEDVLTEEDFYELEGALKNYLEL